MPLLVRDTAMTIEKGHTMKISQRVIRSLCLFGLWLGLGLQAHAQTDTVTYIYTDPQGTPLVEADAQGNVIARYDYTPYGNSVASLGNPPSGPGYTGHVNDPETGLVYMQARYYQPDGRFLSPDPVGPTPGNLLSFNRYVYATNNPLRYIDPDGRDPAPFFFIAMLKYINNAINDSIQRHYVGPAQYAYRKIDNNVEIIQSAQATLGLGLQGTNNVLHPTENSLSVIMGEGANYSVDFAPKNPLTFHFGSNRDPGGVKYAMDFQFGAGPHAGVALSLDTNGNLSIKPKAGIGIGEAINVKVPRTKVELQPAVEIDFNENDAGTNQNNPRIANDYR